MNRVHYTNCPLCHSSQVNPLLTVKDHSVSGDDFVIWQCSLCTLRFTQDVPDQDSIGRYYQSQEYISHTNTRKGLVNQLYQKVRKHTLRIKANLVEAYTRKNGILLDLGAGTGAFLHIMKEREWQVTGIEPDEGARMQAKSLYDLSLHMSLEQVELKNNEFDAITLWHVLEHVHDLHHYMDTLKRLLKPGGKIFIAVPNYESLDASIYKLYWAAYDVPRHLYHFTPSAIKKLVNIHGLRLIETKPMWFDSYYISLLSSRYKNGKSSWFSATLNGLRSNVNAIFNNKRCSSLIYIIQSDQRSN